MKTTELVREWGEYWATHEVSETELERIAEASDDIAQAERIWNDETWWTDGETSARAYREMYKRAQEEWVA